MRQAIRAVLAGGVLLVVACGGSSSDSNETGDSGEGGTISAPEAADYVEKYAEISCGGLARCCANAGLSFSEEYCMSRLSTGLSGEAEGTVYDRAAAETCLTSTRNVFRTCGEDAEEELSNQRACGRVFSGTVPLGQPCINQLDCALSPLGEVVCGTIGTESVCVVYVRGVAGDPCGAADQSNPARTLCDVMDGLYCDELSLTCATSRARGEPCTSSGECGDHALCRETCQDGAAEGETCFGNHECQEGLSCGGEFEMPDCRPAARESLEQACATYGG